jgi:hypothetical protein
MSKITSNEHVNGQAAGPAARVAAQPLEPFGNGAVEAAAPEGRDGAGRFTKGWKGGPGNPFALKVAALRAAALEAVTPDDMKRLFRRWCDMALGGDLAAGALLLKYVWGKCPSVDNDGLDADEWSKIVAAMPPRVEVDVARLDAIPLDVAIEALRQAKEKLDPLGRHADPDGREILRERESRRKQRRR